MRISVIEVASVIVFSQSFSGSCIKTWSWLSGTDCTSGFYIAGGIFSMMMFSLCLLAHASMRAWSRAR